MNNSLTIDPSAISNIFSKQTNNYCTVKALGNKSQAVNNFLEAVVNSLNRHGYYPSKMITVPASRT